LEKKREVCHSHTGRDEKIFKTITTCIGESEKDRDPEDVSQCPIIKKKKTIQQRGTGGEKGGNRDPGRRAIAPAPAAQKRAKVSGGVECRRTFERWTETARHKGHHPKNVASWEN